MNKMRVYYKHISEWSKSPNDTALIFKEWNDYSKYNNKLPQDALDFITECEEKGNVYSIEGFLNALNLEEINNEEYYFFQTDLYNPEVKLTSNEGFKETEGKLEYELDWDFITDMAKRMNENKIKYGKYNWKKPIDTEDLKQSLLRHTLAVLQDKTDEDHLAAIACNSMMINYQQNTN